MTCLHAALRARDLSTNCNAPVQIGRNAAPWCSHKPGLMGRRRRAFEKVDILCPRLIDRRERLSLTRFKESEILNSCTKRSSSGRPAQCRGRGARSIFRLGAGLNLRERQTSDLRLAHRPDPTQVLCARCSCQAPTRYICTARYAATALRDQSRNRRNRSNVPAGHVEPRRFGKKTNHRGRQQLTFGRFKHDACSPSVTLVRIKKAPCGAC